MSESIWAWVDGDPEVMGDAADLAEALGAKARAIATGIDAAVLAAAGAESVLVLDAPYRADVYAAAIADAVGQRPPAVLMPGTANGSDLAPRLGVRLGAACLLDCAWIRPEAGGLAAARWAYDDRVLERWDVPAGVPLVATMRPGSRSNPTPRPRQPEVEPLNAPERSGAVRRLRLLPADPGSVRLAEAERIVAAGLGIGSAEMVPLVQELADLLGAALGASRPVADRGWVPADRQIGSTGQMVSPRLYFAVGISGASQHLAGIRDAATVVAVNTDPACPMMARATLGAVGDAAEILPALNRALRRELT